MTQIKKTLSIAGIIALVTAPAMSDIASTAYVQNIVNNVIPTSGMVGHVLKKTASGVEWAAAPTTTLETTTGTSTTATMTQKAITDALNTKLSNNATGENNLAIGSGANATGGMSEVDQDEYEFFESLAIGKDATATGASAIAIGGNSRNGGGPAATGEDSIVIGSAAYASGIGAVSIGGAAGTSGAGSVAIGNGSVADEFSVAIGNGAYAEKQRSIVIGGATTVGEDAIAIGGFYTIAQAQNSIALGSDASVGGNASGAIQLGAGINNTANTLQFRGFSLVDANGKIPAERLTNAPAPSLESILPTAPNNCKASDGQQCALVMTWSSSQNKFTYSWEVVKVSQ